MSSEVQHNALYPIREVSKLTGVNSITLRAWERRYNLIEPVRTESGHRLYTQNDIDTLKQVTQLTDQGIPISRVKPLLEEVATEQHETIAREQNPETQLFQAIADCQAELVNKTLDGLFADFPETVWQNTIRQVLQKINEMSGDSTLQRFGEAMMTPRLNSRLHLSLRALKPPYQYLWIQTSVNTHPLLATLIALEWVRKGYYPLIQNTPQTNGEKLFQQLQKTKCQGVVVIDHSEAFDDGFWQQWTEQHPSYELHLYLKQSAPNLAQKIQVSYTQLAD